MAVCLCRACRKEADDPQGEGISFKKRALGKSVSKAMLVTVMAACNVLQQFGVPAATVAAVRGLQGAKPMTPAEISSLPLSGLQSAREDNDSINDNDAPAAAQQTNQAAYSPAQASCSMLQRKGAPAAKRAEEKGQARTFSNVTFRHWLASGNRVPAGAQLRLAYIPGMTYC